MVESTALEMRHRGNSIGGSNPSLSAMIFLFFETTSLVMRPFGMAALDRLFQSDRLLAVSLLTLLVAAWPHFLICCVQAAIMAFLTMLAAWSHFIGWYNWAVSIQQPIFVAAWPHFLICYNKENIVTKLLDCCGLTAFSNLLQHAARIEEVGNELRLDRIF